MTKRNVSFFHVLLIRINGEKKQPLLGIKKDHKIKYGINKRSEFVFLEKGLEIVAYVRQVAKGRAMSFKRSNASHYF